MAVGHVAHKEDAGKSIGLHQFVEMIRLVQGGVNQGIPQLLAFLFRTVEQLGIKGLGNAGTVVIPSWKKEGNGAVPPLRAQHGTRLSLLLVRPPHHHGPLTGPLFNQPVIHQKLERLADRCPVHLVCLSNLAFRGKQGVP